MNHTSPKTPSPRLRRWAMSGLATASLLIFSAFTAEQNPIRMLEPARTFGPGEFVDYRVHYGWITAGEATMKVYNDAVRVDNKNCFRIEVSGKSTGAFDAVLRIRDTWGSYFDTSSLLPVKSYRNIEEGKYRRYEETFFDHEARKARMEVYNEKRRSELTIPAQVQDIVSGYYYLRLVDYNKLVMNQTVTLHGILEDKTYEFRVRYRGKEKLKTKFGKINAIKLAPIMPNNELFDGEDSIVFYVSDDQNRVPLKIRAELFVGSVELDIKNYGGLKVPLKFEN